MRLLWLIDSLHMGGAESLVLPFAKRLDRAQYELFVCSLGTVGTNALEAELRDSGIAVTNLGARNLRDVRAFRRLVRFAREQRIELVHAHLTYSAVWSALLSRVTGIPSVATLHVAPSATREQKKTATHRVLTDVRDRLMRFALDRWSSAVIMVSDALRRTYLAAGGLRADKLRVVHNGIELERFRRDREETRTRLLREFNLPPDARIAVTVSVLRPAKGIEVLLDAVRLVPDTHFLIVGDGPKREEWSAVAEQTGIADRVQWAGFRRDVDTILAGCDLFVHPSLDDAFPTVLLEALAAGLPIVASNVGGIPEIVADGVTGRLVPPGNPQELAAAIHATRAASREAALAASQKFSTEAWIERLTRVYAEVSSSGSSGSSEFLGASERTEVSLTPPRNSEEPRGTPKIAYLEPSGKGGMIHYAFQLCRALAQTGADVTLITERNYELATLEHPFRVETTIDLWDPKPAGRVSTAPWAVAWRKLRRITRAVRYYKEWLRQIRRVEELNPDVVLIGDIRFPFDLFPLLLLRRKAKTFVDICHNVHPFSTSGVFDRNRWREFFYRRIYKLFDVVFVHFERNRGELLKSFGIDPQRVGVIVHGNEDIFRELRTSGVDATALRRRLGLPDAQPVVLFFGTLSRYKGTDVLIEAFARVQKETGARLVLAGFPFHDFDVAAHQELTRKLGVADSVTWVPEYIDSGDVAAWMELASVIVFPYRDIYQSGALHVAQSFGVPTIASAIGAMQDVLEHEVSGLLVPPNDVAALADALSRLLKDRALAQRLGQRFLQDAQGPFAWTTIAGIIVEATGRTPAAGATGPGPRLRA